MVNSNPSSYENHIEPLDQDNLIDTATRAEELEVLLDHQSYLPKRDIELHGKNYSGWELEYTKKRQSCAARLSRQFLTRHVEGLRQYVYKEVELLTHADTIAGYIGRVISLQYPEGSPDQATMVQERAIQIVSEPSRIDTLLSIDDESRLLFVEQDFRVEENTLDTAVTFTEKSNVFSGVVSGVNPKIDR